MFSHNKPQKIISSYTPINCVYCNFPYILSLIFLYEFGLVFIFLGWKKDFSSNHQDIPKCYTYYLWKALILNNMKTRTVNLRFFSLQSYWVLCSIFICFWFLLCLAKVFSQGFFFWDMKHEDKFWMHACLKSILLSYLIDNCPD